MLLASALLAVVVQATGCNQSPVEAPAPDAGPPRRLGERRGDAGPALPGEPAGGGVAHPSGGAGSPSGGPGDASGTDAATGVAAQTAGDATGTQAAMPALPETEVPTPGLPPAAAPHPRSPEVDTLLRMAAAAAAEISEPPERCRLELGIARVEARYAPEVAAGRIGPCAARHPDLEEVRTAVLALAGQDTAAALRVIRGIPGERHVALVAAIAENLAALDANAALAVLSTVESRIVREQMLVSLLPAVQRHGPDSVAMWLDRIVEPLLNDFAMARSRAESAAAGAVLGPESVEQGIESRLVRRWALLDVALRLATRLPEAALSLSEHLTLPLDRDEVYAAAAPGVVPASPDRAVGLVLRIGDRAYRAEAAESIASGLFEQRPAMALHLVLTHLPPARAREAATTMFAGLCSKDPARLEEVYREAKTRLGPDLSDEVLAACCASAPREVRRIVSGGPDDMRERAWYRSCLVCAGLDSDATATVPRIADGEMRKEAATCLARQVAPKSVALAMQTLDLLEDPSSRDDARFALLLFLLANRDTEHAARVAAALQDRYVAARGAIRLAASTSEEKASTLDALERQLLSIADSWRRDDLLADAVRECSRYPRQARVRLASAVVDPALRQMLFTELAAATPAADVLDAALELPAEASASARADWYLALCRLTSGVLAAPATEEVR